MIIQLEMIGSIQIQHLQYSIGLSMKQARYNETVVNKIIYLNQKKERKKKTRTERE